MSRHQNDETSAARAERLWDELIDRLNVVLAIRFLEMNEQKAMARYNQAASRMLDLCAVQKLKQQGRVAELVDLIAADPHWDPEIAALDREALAEQVRKYGGL